VAEALIPQPRVVRAPRESDALPAAESLPPEGYAILIDAQGAVSFVAPDAAGHRHARATLAQLGASARLFIVDWPQLPIRGVIEGFYGEPWTHEQRLQLMQLSEGLKLNTYVYAPKDDPYHRMDWRTPYPADELARLAHLVAAASAHGVDFVYALHPAMSMRFSDDTEHALLHAKAAQLHSIGIGTIALLFDDVPAELTDARDVGMFGSGGRGLGLAHGLTCARFEREFMVARGITQPLLMVPMDYAGDDPSPYRTALAETLPATARVWWTGHDVVVGTIDRDDIDRAGAAFERELVLWDNFPVNDFDRTRAFLGPLHGRTTHVGDSALRGITVNPMVEFEPSAFGIASAADWAWNTPAFDEQRSAEAALRFVGSADAAALAPLVAALSSWPPSAPQYPRLAGLLQAALRGEPHDGLAALLDGMAAAGSVRRAGLQPWIDAGSSMAAAASAALGLLHGSGDAATVRALFDEASTHFAGVARDSLPGFVREVLRRHERGAAPTGAVIRVVCQPEPTAGEVEMFDHLHARGLRTTTAGAASGAASGADFSDAALVIVMPGSPPDSAIVAAASGAPVLAWAHLAALGLSTEPERILTQTRVDIVEPSHPLAAGLSGAVDVYRGPWFMTSAVPSDDAVVVARTVFEHRPAIVHYPSRRAVAFFFAKDAASRWLVTPEGLRLFDAAVDLLLR
jgi:hypothetical protein